MDQYCGYYHLILLAFLRVQKSLHSAQLLKCPTKGPAVTATSAFMSHVLNNCEEKTTHEFWMMKST